MSVLPGQTSALGAIQGLCPGQWNVRCTALHIHPPQCRSLLQIHGNPTIFPNRYPVNAVVRPAFEACKIDYSSLPRHLSIIYS